MTAVPLDRPLRAALVGAGFAAAHHLNGWRAAPGAELVAIADLDVGKARKLGAEFGAPAVYADVEEMLDRERPDALDICAPPEAHATLLEVAAARGVHVMCQKPVALDLPTALAMRDAARRGGVRLMVHENFRFRPWHREIKAILAAGVIGRPRYARSDERYGGTVRTAANPETPWSVARQPRFADCERLLILESAIHQIDVCRFLLGEARSVYTQAMRVGQDVIGEDLVSLSMRFGDAIVMIERSYAARGYPPPPSASEIMTIEGELGALFLDREGGVRVEIDHPGERRTLRPEIDRSDAYGRSYAGAIRHFVEALRTGAPFETDIEDNLRTLAATLAAYESWRDGRAIDLTDTQWSTA